MDYSTFSAREREITSAYVLFPSSVETCHGKLWDVRPCVGSLKAVHVVPLGSYCQRTGATHWDTGIQVARMTAFMNSVKIAQVVERWRLEGSRSGYHGAQTSPVEVIWVQISATDTLRKC